MRRTLCLLAVAASLAVSSVASAQQPAQQPSPNAEAVRHFLAGKAHRDAGDCKAAIDELNLSVLEEESIGARYNLGFCYEKTGNKKLALSNYKRAEQLAKTKGDERQREIGAQVRFFFEQTTHIRLALPQPTPPDLQVLIDGEQLPNEEFEGLQIYFPPAKRKAYELRVSAAGYEDLKQSIPTSTVDNKTAVTVVLNRPGAPETKWGPFQFLGLGLMVVGAVGITYSSVQFVSYLSDEETLRKKFNDAETAAKGCPSDSPPTSTCGKNIDTREFLRGVYNRNEESGTNARPILLTIGIGAILAVAGGLVLIVAGPRAEVERGTAAKAPPRPTFRVVPTVGGRAQGLSVVGTF